MKKYLLVAVIFTVSFISFSTKSQVIEVPSGETLRVFYQVVEDDMRFTGCVVIGGTCFSDEPTSVQDCLSGSDGTWVPCGWE